MEIQTLPLAEKKKPIEDESKLVFGKQFTDRMFVMEYDRGKGWHSARIAPYGPFSLDPGGPGSSLFPGNFRGAQGVSPRRR